MPSILPNPHHSSVLTPPFILPSSPCPSHLSLCLHFFPFLNFFPTLLPIISPSPIHLHLPSPLPPYLPLSLPSLSFHSCTSLLTFNLPLFPPLQGVVHIAQWKDVGRQVGLQHQVLLHKQTHTVRGHALPRPVQQLDMDHSTTRVDSLDQHRVTMETLHKSKLRYKCMQHTLQKMILNCTEILTVHMLHDTEM